MLIINLAFMLFFMLCIILIVYRVRELKRLDDACEKEKLDNSKIRLYNEDKELSTGLDSLYADRLSDTSVHFHKRLYKTEQEYKEYKKEVMKLNLP